MYSKLALLLCIRPKKVKTQRLTCELMFCFCVSALLRLWWTQMSEMHRKLEEVRRGEVSIAHSLTDKANHTQKATRTLENKLDRVRTTPQKHHRAYAEHKCSLHGSS